MHGAVACAWCNGMCMVQWHVHGAVACAWCMQCSGMYACMVQWHVHGAVACMHGAVACMHGAVACMHGAVACMHVAVACMHVAVACMHGAVAYMHGAVACMVQWHVCACACIYYAGYSGSEWCSGSAWCSGMWWHVCMVYSGMYAWDTSYIDECSCYISNDPGYICKERNLLNLLIFLYIA